MLNSSQDDFSVRINACAGFRCINVTASFEGTVPRVKLIGIVFGPSLLFYYGNKNVLAFCNFLHTALQIRSTNNKRLP